MFVYVRHYHFRPSRQRIGFAFAIETAEYYVTNLKLYEVARGLASRLRLKLGNRTQYEAHLRCRQRIGFAFAIETRKCLLQRSLDRRRQRIGFAFAIETLMSALGSCISSVMSPEDWLRICD